MATQTTIQQNQIGFAPEVAPYAQNILGTAAGMVYQYQKDANGKNVLDENGMPIITGFQPYQEYTGDRQAQFTPLQKQSFDSAQQMQTSGQLQDASTMAENAGIKALNLNYDPSNFRTGSVTDANALDQYMSPYVKNVVERQQQDAALQSRIAQQGQQAQAARAGAFGGSGDYLMRGQAARDLARQKGDIMATGMQNAYTQATNQFNTEQQNRYNEAQLNEQSRQYGAGLGLQGLQTANQAATNLANIGQTQFTQGMDINKLQNQYGTQQQNQMNTILGNQYQEYLNKMNHPYKQIGYMSDVIRGAPLSQMGSTMYAPAPNPITQVAGAVATGYGASMGRPNKKGGVIKEQRYARGGSVQDVTAKERPAGLAELAIYKMA